MFQKTSNPYEFKYLVTGLTGDGIKEIYMPQQPRKELIHDLGGGWERQDLPKNYKFWLEEFAQTGRYNPEFSSYEDLQFHYRKNGYWFYNTVNGKKTPTFLTGIHWWQLQWLKCKARTKTGYLDFRDPIKEIFYLWDFVCNDPKSYGLILGGPRRISKSTIMAAIGLEYTSRTPLALCGIQGEKDEKAKKFYNEHILYPFKRLPEFFMPTYNTNTGLSEGIQFSEPILRGKNQRAQMGQADALESSIECGPTKDINHFNGRLVDRYLMEEGGKIKIADPRKLWAAVKDAQRIMDEIVGKTISATTADASDDDDSSDGGVSSEFMELVYQSDYDKRLDNGETLSGLTAALMPSQHVYTFDRYGIPDSVENYRKVMAMRPDVKAEPLLYSQAARKNPTTWEEYFYANVDKCLFNVMILQAVKAKLAKMPNIYERYDLIWKDGVKFSKVIAIPSKTGKFLFHKMPLDWQLNKVRDTNSDGFERFEPLNKEMFVIGHDPIMFKVISGRRSSPVALAIRKYDSSIDGELTEELAKYRSEIEYPYETGYPWIYYDWRPDEPSVYFELMIMLCWFLGCEMNVERQHGAAIIEHFKTNGCKKFIMDVDSTGGTLDETDKKIEGQQASQKTTSHFSSLIATWVSVFGHCNPFLKLNQDLIDFDSSNTLKYDKAVALGMGLLGARQQIRKKAPPVTLEELFEVFDTSGNTATLRH